MKSQFTKQERRGGRYRTCIRQNNLKLEIYVKGMRIRCILKGYVKDTFTMQAFTLTAINDAEKKKTST